jgi:hypothetical protein
MGMRGGWFRTRPSDEEMREEREAHVAMRAEHDGVDDAAALPPSARAGEQVSRLLEEAVSHEVTRQRRR